MPADPAPQGPVARIRRNVERWDGLGGIADEVDYGKIDVAILRDIRTLLAALSAEKEAHAWTLQSRNNFMAAYDELLATGSAGAALTAALAERDSWKKYGEDCAHAMVNSPAAKERDAALAEVERLREAVIAYKVARDADEWGDDERHALAQFKARERMFRVALAHPEPAEGGDDG